MSDSPILLEGIFPKIDPLGSVTISEVGPEIASSLGLQSEAEKETAELLETCRQWVRQFVIVSDEQAVILAAWILHTWVFEAAETTPYIHITAPERECGKSRLMETLEALACNPIRSGGMTAAALVRCIDAKNPTIFLDEMDAQLGADKEVVEAIRGILNEGFRKGGKFYKVDGKQHELREFNAYCPKCFAGIGKLPETVSSRSIAIEMRRKTEGEKVRPLRQRQLKDASQPIRERLDRWKARGIAIELEESRPAPIEGLGDRQNDISEPLLAIAGIAGVDWLLKLRSALATVLKGSQGANVSNGETLLMDIRSIFDERGTEKIFSKDLAAALCEIEGRPWADWNRGTGFRKNDLAKQLHRYHIHPQKVSIGAEKLQGYRLEHFTEAWERYCAPLPRDAGTSELSASALAKKGSGEVPGTVRPQNDWNCSNPHKQREVPAVPAVPTLFEQGELRL